MLNPERFDPQEGAGRLIDSEHRARYHWASRTVAGKDVLDAACGVGYGVEILAAAGAKSVSGIDLDPEAVATAKERFGEHAAALVEGDLRELPFEDDSFDVVTSFETIEHMEEGERALAEMRRVLRPGGLLIVSSPNPDAYLPGNEFHVHEFRPEELTAAVDELFANVTTYRQDAWLGSAIEPLEGEPSTATPELLSTGSGEEEEPDYSIVVASDEALPELDDILARGDTFDVRWWAKQLARARGEAAQAGEREAIAQGRLEETAAALLDANQELAQIPLLRHRLAAIEEQHAKLSAEYHALLGSTSWKITAPLRRGGRG
jgi:ubiquinone/menaquinone biosynthesis C-methylase UbiE